MSTKLSQVGFGLNQTRQNVTGTRAINTLYTNTTGKPIALSIHLSGVATRTLDIDGVPTAPLATEVYFSEIILNGQTYKITSSGSPAIDKWLEIR